MNPLTPLHEILLQNTGDLRYGENPKSLSYLVFDRYRDVTPRQTNRQNYDS